MKELIIDIAVLIIALMIVLVSYGIVKKNAQEEVQNRIEQVYIQKWVSPETHVCYYVTEYAICPIYNADGTFYEEKID